MPQYIFDDEDNESMHFELMDGEELHRQTYTSYQDVLDRDGHNPTVYNSIAEMKAIEAGIPFDDPIKDGCWNCFNYDGNRCHLGWNNNDESYYQPETDDKDPDDWCPGYDKDESIRPEEFFNE